MLNVSGDGTAVANATDAIATLFNITGENATFVNASCQDLRELSSLNKAAFSERMLEAARMSAEQWAATTSVLSVVSSVLDVFIVVALVVMRRHRPIQRQGLGFLICLVVGCFLGHMASILDSRQPSAALCRGRLAVIYMFIYGLLAPLFGKLISLCRAANNVLLAGHASGWDPLARKVTYSLYGLQGISLIFYLALTAGKPSRKDRLQTVCSDAVSEHAFHFTDGFFAAAILLACFGMIAWLEVAALSNRDDSARHGSKDLLLCAIAVAGGALGLLLLLATSTQDIAWASAVVPVRLLIILLSAYTVLGFQVVPPLFVAVRDRLDVLLHPHGRRKQVRTEATIQKMVAVQQKQLLRMEAEVVERQRALRENQLRLKLMTEPILTAWVDVCCSPLNAGSDGGHHAAAGVGGGVVGSVGGFSLTAIRRRGASEMVSSYASSSAYGTELNSSAQRASSGEARWERYFARLYQTKKLVFWADASESQRQMPPKMVIDLFEVREIEDVVVGGGGAEDPGGGVALPGCSGAALPVCATAGVQQQGELQLATKSGPVQLRLVDTTGGDLGPDAPLHPRLRKAMAERMADNTRIWRDTIKDMLREINEPDHPPSFQEAKVWVGTWNLGNAAPDVDQLRDWFGVDSEKHHVYAIGLQESTFALSKEQKHFGNLVQYVSRMVEEALGSEYRVVEAKQMWEIRLLLVVHEERMPHLEVLDSASEATGIGGVGGNKGGVAIAISLHRTTICFCTAHLAAHQEFVKRRNRDSVDIFKGMRTLGSAKRPGIRSLDPTIGFDHTFFFGDLNYRIAAPIEFVLDALDSEMALDSNKRRWGKLHDRDQLREEMSAQRTLCGFNETPPSFPPTFKVLKAERAGEMSRHSQADGGEALEEEEQKRYSKRGKGHGGVLAAFKSLTPGKGSDFGAARAGQLAGASCGTVEEGDSDDDQSRREEEEGEGDEDHPAALGDNDEEQPVGGAVESTAVSGKHVAEAERRLQDLGYNAKRIPSWCDRILWRSYPMCSCSQTAYSSVEGVSTSDHKPVFATFSVRVMLPHDNESKDAAEKGDLYQWDLSIANVALRIPLSAFDDEDAAATRTATPELQLEFYGVAIRIGYTTPPLTATLDKGNPNASSPAALVATFAASMSVPLTDLAQRLGPMRLGLAHLVMQVVAVFGTRRVIVGATVMPLDAAIQEPGAARECSLLNCGVDAGATMTLQAALRDSGSGTGAGAGTTARKSFDKLRAVSRKTEATGFGRYASAGQGRLWKRAAWKTKIGSALLADSNRSHREASVKTSMDSGSVPSSPSVGVDARSSDVDEESGSFSHEFARKTPETVSL